MNEMSSQLPSRHTLPQRNRLKRKRDFQEVYEHGRRVGGRILTVWALPYPHDTRVGFVASRRVGGAVVRNRAKRLLREAFRMHRAELVGSYHIVLVARSACPGASRDQIEAELVGHLRKAGCFGGSPTGAPDGTDRKRAGSGRHNRRRGRGRRPKPAESAERGGGEGREPRQGEGR